MSKPSDATATLTLWRENAPTGPADLIQRGLRLAIELESPLISDDAAPKSRTTNQDVSVRGTTDWAEVWLQRGHHKFHQGDYPGAAANYEQALQRQPHLVAAHNAQGNVFYAQRNFAAAQAAFEQALSLQPSAHIHCNLGSVLHCLGDFLGAIASYRAAIDLDSLLVNAHYGLGVVFHHQGQLKAAVGAYNRATQINPNHADSHYGLGCLCYDSGDHRGAIAAFRKAMQCNPAYTDIYLRLQGSSD